MCFVLLVLNALMSGADARFDPLPQFEQLSNGLRVLVVEDPALPLVSVSVVVRIGVADDPPDGSGAVRAAANEFERAAEASARLRASGLEHDRRVTWDACWFETIAPSQLLDSVLAIEAERMAALRAFRAEGLAGLDANTVSSDALDGLSEHRAILAELLAGHPYGRAESPDSDVAPSFRRESVGRALLDAFAPANATLLIVGDVQTAAALSLVRLRFAGLESGVSRPREHRDLPVAERRSIVVPQAAWELTAAWLAPRLGSAERAAWRVLMQQLCDESDGALRGAPEFAARELRWKFLDAADAGVLVLEVGFRDSAEAGVESARSLEAALRAHVERAATAVPDAAAHDLHRASSADVALAEPNFPRRARRLAELEVLGGDVLLAELEPLVAARVGVLDVQAAARSLVAARSVTALACARAAAPRGEMSRAIAGDSARPDLSIGGAPLAPDSGRAARLRGLPDGGAALVLSLPGARQCAAAATFGGPWDGRAVPLSASEALPGWTSAQTSAFLRLRGVRAYQPAVAADAGLLLTGPARELDAMLEILARRAEVGASRGARRVVIGDFESMQNAEAFSGADVSESAATTRPGPDRDVRPAREWTWEPSDEFEVRLAIRPAECGRAALIVETALIALALRLGVAPPAIAQRADDAGPGRGRATVGGGLLRVSLPATESNAVAALRDALAALDGAGAASAREDALEAQTAIAVRRAWIALHSPMDVALAVAGGALAPWDELAGFGPERWRAWASEALPTARVEVVVRAPPEALVRIRAALPLDVP